MDRRRSGAKSPQRFRPKKRHVDDLLNPDVLDDDTRRMLMEEVMNPANRPRGGETGSPKPRQRDVATGVDVSVQPPSPSLPSAKAKEEKDSRFPAQLRSRVHSGSDDLVTAMAARLGDLEKKQKHYTSEIDEMRTRYMKLNDAYQKEVKRRDEAEQLVVDLYDEKKELEEEMAEMRQCLADYGHSWNGPATPRKQKGKQNASGDRAGGSRSPSPAQSEAAKFDLYDGNYESPSQAVSLQTDAAGASPPLSRHNSGPVHFANTAKKGTQLFCPPSPEKEKVAKVKQPVGWREDGGVDVALLIKNARILSDYVGWKAIVKVGDRGGAIRDRDVVRMVVYQNGICVNNGAFRPYGWALCDAFINDLAEGYYPYEFKDKYPDGFPIEVTDRSSEKLDVRNQSPQRGGAGHRLGGDGDDPRKAKALAVPSTGGGGGSSHAAPSLQQLREGGYHPISADDFLKKIPAQTVTSDGKIVNVRDGVSQLMGKKEVVSQVPLGTIRHVTAAEAQYRQTEAKSHVVPAVPAQKDEEDGHQMQAGAGTIPPMVLGDLVALLIRLPDGKKVKLNLPRTSTIYDVRKEFIAAAPDFARKRYELCQAYPAKTFSDHHLTLEELGITRTCTLMIRLGN